MNIARLHREQTLARQAAQKAGSANPFDAETGEGGEGVDARDPATAFTNLMLAKLTEDRSRLSEIQSIEGKNAAKVQFLPEYDAWLKGTMEAKDDLPESQPNDILTTLMIWHLDVGNYAICLDLAEVVLAKGIPLPSKFNRTAATAIAEEIAEAVFKSLRDKTPFERAVIDQTLSLTHEHDMFDEVRAKLFKADAMLRSAEIDQIDAGGAAPDGMAGATSVLAEDALNSAKRALELNPNSGVKALITKLEKRLAKADPATS